MAFDAALAERVRELLGPRSDVAEKRMFGGVAFMVAGHMACGVTSGGEAMLRLGPEGCERALARPHVRPMDLTGRPMKGFVLADPSGLGDDGLAELLDDAVDFVLTLPPKA